MKVTCATTVNQVTCHDAVNRSHNTQVDRSQGQDDADVANTVERESRPDAPLRNDQARERGSDERAEVLRRGFTMVQEAPLTGHGPGAGARIPMANGVLGAHNEYLATWVSHGLVGLLAWCAFLCRLGRRRAAGLATLRDRDPAPAREEEAPVLLPVTGNR